MKPNANQHPRLRSLGLILPLVAGLLAAQCTEEGRLAPNQPPETILFVDDGEQTATHYMQILSWHGEDIDGEVERYEYKWTLEEGVAPGDFPVDWVGLVEPFVTESKDTFWLPVPSAGLDTVVHNFQVRAVDGQGAVDPTPASADLRVFNAAPRLFAVVNGDTTSVLTLPPRILPVLSVQFRVLDADNPSADPEHAGDFLAELRFWFDDPLDYMLIPGSDTLLTLLPEDFGDLSGEGETRSLHLQAVDKAGAASNILAAETFVRNISQAKVLILDSSRASSPLESTVDAFWHEDIAGQFPPEEIFIHVFETDGPLVHPDFLHAIFSLFEAVIWYNGGAGSADDHNASLPTPEIGEAEEALVTYLEAGGKVLITGYNLIGASASEISGGSFSADFEEEILLSDSLFVHTTGTVGGAVTSNWRFWPPTATIPGIASAGTDTLKNANQLRGVDRMSPKPDALASGVIEKLYELSGSSVFPPSLEDGTVGLRRHFEGGGELVLLTFPISLAGGNGRHKDQVERFLRDFGVLPP